MNMTTSQGCSIASSLAVSALFISLLIGAVRAGTIEKKFGSDPGAIAAKMDLNLMSRGSGSPKGTGPVPYLPALGAPPKRVALVSFYVWDSGNVTGSVYNTSIQWSVTKTVTGTGRERVANALR